MAHGMEPQFKELSQAELAGLNDEQRMRYEHEKLHEKHKGHEAMHAEMMLILMVTLLIGQAVLVFWKSKFPRSYQTATVVAMWFVPAVVCVRSSWYRFLIIWFIFTMITGNVCYYALQKPINIRTPRWVYRWFLTVYRVCYSLGIFGYLVMLLTFLGFNVLLGVRPDVGLNYGLLILFYGVYFGVLSRDFSEVCTDQMAASVGFYSPRGLPDRQLDESVCAVCGNQIEYIEGETTEKRYALTCGHTFHEFCIRGWYIVGKKQTCPYCKEKVDLKRLFGSSPWEKTHIYYSNYLDMIRFLVAWLPIIFSFVQGVNWVLGLE